jgi:hypothetical protein
MKNLILLLAIVSVLFSCKKETIETIYHIEYNKGYRVYTFNITQYSNNDPEVDVLKDEIGGFVWSRNSIGLYDLENKGVFIDGKVWIDNNSVIYEVAGNDIIRFKTYSNGDPSDNQLNNTPIEIRIYD